MPLVTAAAIAGGASIYGAYKSSKGNTDAAKTQAASDDQALKQAKEIYEQQREDQGPYRSSGYGALDALNYGLGLPSVPRPATAEQKAATAASLTPYVVPGAKDAKGRPANGTPFTGNIVNPDGTPFNPLATSLAPGATPPAQGGGGSVVKIRNPKTGFVYLVPAERAAEAQQNGGQVI